MQATVLYLLAAVGVFHTQALHATIQLRGERGTAVTLHCQAAWGLGTAPLFWKGPVPFQGVPAPRQLPLPSDTLPSSPPEGAGRHLNPFALAG